MSKEILYTIMVASGVGSIIALGYAQYQLYKANKYLYKTKMVQCNHKWKIPLMYNKNNYYNPTECVKCGKSISHFWMKLNWRGQRIFKPKQR